MKSYKQTGGKCRTTQIAKASRQLFADDEFFEARSWSGRIVEQLLHAPGVHTIIVPTAGEDASH